MLRSSRAIVDPLKAFPHEQVALERVELPSAAQAVKDVLVAERVPPRLGMLLYINRHGHASRRPRSNVS